MRRFFCALFVEVVLWHTYRGAFFVCSSKRNFMRSLPQDFFSALLHRGLYPSISICGLSHVLIRFGFFCLAMCFACALFRVFLRALFARALFVRSTTGASFAPHLTGIFSVRSVAAFFVFSLLQGLFQCALWQGFLCFLSHELILWDFSLSFFSVRSFVEFFCSVRSFAAFFRCAPSRGAFSVVLNVAGSSSMFYFARSLSVFSSTGASFVQIFAEVSHVQTFTGFFSVHSPAVIFHALFCKRFFNALFHRGISVCFPSTSFSVRSSSRAVSVLFFAGVSSVCSFAGAVYVLFFTKAFFVRLLAGVFFLDSFPSIFSIQFCTGTFTVLSLVGNFSVRSLAGSSSVRSGAGVTNRARLHRSFFRVAFLHTIFSVLSFARSLSVFSSTRGFSVQFLATNFLVGIFARTVFLQGLLQ